MTLISKIRTIEERDKLNSELDFLLTNLYEHGGASLDTVLRTQIRAWVSSEIRDGVPEGSDTAATEAYLKDLKSKLTGLQILKLKIAFEPTDTSIDKFFDYIRKNIKDGVILDFEIDPEIFGGAEITYKGEYRDFSLKRLFESEYKAQEVELMKLISSK